MDKLSVLEYIKWVEKLISAHRIYYESGHIDDFKKWMDAEEIVQFIGKYIQEESAKQLNNDVYEIILN